MTALKNVEVTGQLSSLTASRTYAALYGKLVWVSKIGLWEEVTIAMTSDLQVEIQLKKISKNLYAVWGA